jgi:hypothetical protein
MTNRTLLELSLGQLEELQQDVVKSTFIYFENILHNMVKY